MTAEGFRLLIYTRPGGDIAGRFPLATGQEIVGEWYGGIGQVVVHVDLGDMGRLLTHEQFLFVNHDCQVDSYSIHPLDRAEALYPTAFSMALPLVSWGTRIEPDLPNPPFPQKRHDGSRVDSRSDDLREWARAEFSRSKNVRIYGA